MKDLNDFLNGGYGADFVSFSHLNDAFILTFEPSQITINNSIDNMVVANISGYGVNLQFSLIRGGYFVNVGDSNSYYQFGVSIPINSERSFIYVGNDIVNQFFRVLPTVPGSTITYGNTQYNLLDVGFAFKDPDTGKYTRLVDSSANNIFYSPYYLIPYYPNGALVPNSDAYFYNPDATITNMDPYIYSNWVDDLIYSYNVNPNINSQIKLGAQLASNWRNVSDNKGIFAYGFPQYGRSLHQIQQGAHNVVFDFNVYGVKTGAWYRNNSSKQTALNTYFLNGQISTDYSTGLPSSYTLPYTQNVIATLNNGSSLFNFIYFDNASQSFKLYDFDTTFGYDYINKFNSEYNLTAPVISSGVSYGSLTPSFASGMFSSFATNPFLTDYAAILSSNGAFDWNDNQNIANYMLYENLVHFDEVFSDLSTDDIIVSIALIPYQSRVSSNSAFEFLTAMSPLFANLNFTGLSVVSLIGVLFTAMLIKFVRGLV